MCQNCNYKEMLTGTNLEPTPNRLQVLELIGDSNCPLAATEIYTTLARSSSINRVTVYRILDLLVENKLLDRISSGSRAAYYGLAPNEHHRAHPHFYCKICGQMDCLSPDSLTFNTETLRKNFPGRIDKVEIRIDGVCDKCQKDLEDEFVEEQ